MGTILPIVKILTIKNGINLTTTRLNQFKNKILLTRLLICYFIRINISTIDLCYLYLGFLYFNREILGLSIMMPLVHN